MRIPRLLILLMAGLCSTTCADAAEPTASDLGLPPLELKLVARGLRNPLDIVHDGTDRQFIVEQPGKIRLLRGGKIEPQPFLDLSDRIAYGGECGLLGLAFHPHFAENGLFYVNYTSNRPRLKTFITEFKVIPEAIVASKTTERIVLSFDQPFSNHNGGHLMFGPDGMLYIATGDGGAGGDPHNAGQRTDTLLGKILRIDVDQDRTTRGYGIPADNPFVGREGSRPEIWAYGLRNPWRIAFDPVTGHWFTGDVGQNLFEEVDLLVKGGNYGWREREGFHAFNNSQRPASDFIDPIAEYGRDKGQSITGGIVYRGKEIPSLVGHYIYADYASGRFWALKYEDGKVLHNVELNVTADGRPALNRVQAAGFGQDVHGEMFLCDHNGAVYKFNAGQ